MRFFIQVFFASLLLLFSRVEAFALPIVSGSSSFDANTSLYTYMYDVSGVDPGRKVTSVSWLVSNVAEQPAYLPTSWTVPFFWGIYTGGGGYWQAGTGDNDGYHDFPISSEWGTLLTGQTRTFSFTTGYAPRVGTYRLFENQNGSEINYNVLYGTTVVPNYDGSLIESMIVGGSIDYLNYPVWFPKPGTVPEPVSIVLLATGLIGLSIWGRSNFS